MLLCMRAKCDKCVRRHNAADQAACSHEIALVLLVSVSATDIDVPSGHSTVRMADTDQQLAHIH